MHPTPSQPIFFICFFALLWLIFVTLLNILTIMTSRKPSIVDVMKLTGQWMPTKSVSSPSAQTAGLCGFQKKSQPEMFDFQTFSAKNPQLSHVELAVIELQFLFGARISEILHITNADVSQSGMIRLRAEKGSFSRIIRPVYMLDFWRNEASSILPICNTFSRFFFYRLYRRYGLYAHFGSNKKASVTHYFRHVEGAEINSTWNDLQLVKNALGHKSLKSAEYYGKKKRE